MWGQLEGDSDEALPGRLGWRLPPCDALDRELTSPLWVRQDCGVCRSQFDHHCAFMRSVGTLAYLCRFPMYQLTMF